MKTSMGLPEVMLGILPGGGGTQRLPKLVGVTSALPMVLTGKNLTAKKAKKAGLVDTVVESLGPGLAPADVTTHKYLETVAIDIARNLADEKMKLPARGKPKNTVEKITKIALGKDLLETFVQQLMKLFDYQMF